MNTLPVPQAAIDDDNSIQMIQAWIADEAVHVSLNIGIWKDHPDVPEEKGWGCLLADTVYHIANAIRDESGQSSEITRQKIRDYFLKELDAPTTGHSGSFTKE